MSLIIPAFNESKIFNNNIAILEEYVAALEAKFSWELIIVNDGSSDNTGALAESFAAGRTGVQVIHHEKNGGLGAALRTGFAHATGDFVIPVDLDLSYSVEHLSQLISAREKSGADLVLLSPYMPNGKVSQVPFFRKWLSIGANTMLSWAQAGRLHTSTGMVRLYSRKMLDRLNLSAGGMEINLEILHQALLNGASVQEIPAHLNWEHRTDPLDRLFRLSPKKLLRQMALVLRYVRLFIQVRPLVVQRVIP